MARVLTKKSTVAAKVPLATDLEIGELAVNTADAKLYTKHSDNTVKQLGIATNDSRLTDAREWTASTVAQAEAEQGTATTRRAWTAQRVFQAIAAWWAASAMKTKLDGIATGATANSTDAQLRDRTTHTGSQAISTVSGLQTALDGKINTTERGVSGGVATLDQFARIPASQLPSYVDDVLEYPTRQDFPASGEGGKIYIAVNQGTAADPTVWWRWTGTTYVDIPPSPGTTDALVEGSSNLYFNESRVRNTVLTGLSLASSAAVAAADSVLAAFGKLQAQLGLKAPLDSPQLAGNPTAPTPAPTDNDTSIANTAFVRLAMALFGVGATAAPALADLDVDTTPSGLYQVSASTAGLPVGQAGLVVIQRAGSQLVSQRFYSLASDRAFFRRKFGATWGAWQEVWHAGNLVKQIWTGDTTAGALMINGAHGLGASSAPGIIGSLGDVGHSTFFTVTPEMTDRPFNYGAGFRVKYGEAKYGFEFAGNVQVDQFVVRKTGSTGFGAWRELWHTGNLDPATKQNKSSLVTTATTRTLALADAWNYVRPGTTSAITLTVPTDASVAFEIGTEITIRALGNVTLAAASGVTLNAPSGGTLSMTARMTVTLKKVGTHEWDAIGQTEAA